jgi:chromate reductase
MTQRKIGIIVGSLRQGSYSRMLARALPELSPASFRYTQIEIGALPLYNQDLETATPPAPWTEFRQAIIASAALVFVTPEYNRGIPGGLKNAIDVGSRPWGQSAWDGKPAAVISITPGALGAMASNHQLRQVLYGVNVAAMAYPEAYIPGAAALFDESGKLMSRETREFLSGVMQSYERWIESLAPSG